MELVSWQSDLLYARNCLIPIEAGAGKTTLTSGAIEFIHSNVCSIDTVLVYYFLDFSSAESLKSTTALHCLIKQLLQLTVVSPNKLSPDDQTSLEEAYLDK